MPTPKYIGNTSWQRQPEQAVGVNDSGLVFFHIPYAGKTVEFQQFINQWSTGDPCPEPGYSHLNLIKPPQPRDDGSGIRSTATLEFEGEDINGQFGDEEYTESWRDEARDVRLKATSYDPGVYAYLAPTVTYTYTQASKRASDNPRFSPTLEDPKPLTLTSFQPVNPDEPHPLNAADLVSDNATLAIYEIVTYRQIHVRDRTSRGGAWHHEEFHTKRLEPVTKAP